MTRAVVKLVLPAVDDQWTVQGSNIVHKFAACHPLQTTYLGLTAQILIPSVMARGYNAVHSFHSSY